MPPGIEPGISTLKGWRVIPIPLWHDVERRFATRLKPFGLLIPLAFYPVKPVNRSDFRCSFDGQTSFSQYQKPFWLRKQGSDLNLGSAMVIPAGFEPSITGLRAQPPKPLEEGTI